MDENKVMESQIKLGRYQLLQRIGRGGMAEVWLGEDPMLNRRVAIKTLILHNQRDQEYLRRFEREAQAAAALNHPHILQIHDYGTQELPNGQTIAYIVMPYISGGSLADRIEQGARKDQDIPQDEALHYLSQTAEAIDYAHTHGVIHRDIKPANMLLRQDNWLLLADFGIARILSSQEKLTQTGIGFGTPEYMAPEQAQGRAEAASDTYSLAVIAYQLFTGRLPFSAESGYATTMQHIMMLPPSPRQFNPTLSRAIEQTLLHALAKDPQRRPASACAFIVELQRAVGGAALEQEPLPPTPAKPANTPSPEGEKIQESAPGKGITRRRVLIGGGAALLIATGGGLAAWEITHAMHPRQVQTPPSTPHTRKTAIPDPYTPTFTIAGHFKPISSVAWSPKANMLASAGQDAQVMLWDIAMLPLGMITARQAKATLPQLGISGSNMELAWSPDGSMLAIGGVFVFDSSYANLNTAYLSIYTHDLKHIIPNFQNVAFTPANSFSAFAWTPAKYLITLIELSSANANESSNIELLDPKRAPHTLKPANLPLSLSYKSQVNTDSLFVISPDGSTAALATIDGVHIEAFNVTGTTAQWREHAHLQFLFNGFDKEVDGLAWSPDGRYLAAMNSSPYDVASVIWDLQKKNRTPTSLRLPDSGITLQAIIWFSAQRRSFLAAGSQDGHIYLWRMTPTSIGGTATIYPSKTLQGIQAPLSNITCSADGQWLAAAYQDDNNSILVWNTEHI